MTASVSVLIFTGSSNTGLEAASQYKLGVSESLGLEFRDLRTNRVGGFRGAVCMADISMTSWITKNIYQSKRFLKYSRPAKVRHLGNDSYRFGLQSMSASLDITGIIQFSRNWS
jgi:hypothetical protein